MKGIILAGGNGTRFRPSTFGVSKHLLQVYDKPMIYYSLSLLFLSKIKDILLICRSIDINNFRNLLGDGSNFGVKITYAVQDKANGIAEALIIGESFIGKSNFCLILGDNFFYGHNLTSVLQKASKKIKGANILSFEVNNPENFGVIHFNNKSKPIKIEEKPINSRSKSIIPGMYFYTKDAVRYAKKLKKSKRGELEITDINKIFLKKKKLNVFKLGRGVAWLDMGSPDSLNAASNFVSSVQKNQGFLISCLEEISLKNKWININTLKKKIKNKKGLSTEYYEYLKKIIYEN